jgi:hypothetical protein
MDPVDELAVVLAPLLPLRIDEAEYSDPHLMVMGAGWSLALIGAWSGRRGTSSSPNEVRTRPKMLCGTQLATR